MRRPVHTVYRPQPITGNLIRRTSKRKPPEKPKEIRDRTCGLILRHQPSGYLSIYADLGRGKRERICDARRIIDTQSGLTLAYVRNEAKRLRGEAAGGKDFKSQRALARTIPTFKDFLAETYAPWVKQNRSSGQATIDRINACFGTRWGKLKLDEITVEKADRYASERQKAGLTHETINRDVGAVHAALGRAVKLKMLAENPLRGWEPLKIDRHKRVVRALTPDEEGRLRTALEARDTKKREKRESANRWRKRRGYKLLPRIALYADVLTPAVIISLETGLRRGELLAMEWPDISQAERVVRIRGLTTKTFASREIPLSDTAASVLRRWWLQRSKPKEGLVMSLDGKPLGSLRRAYYKALESAEIVRVATTASVNWHSLRHTFGSRLGAAGVDGPTLKALMGHADLTTTQRYLHTDKNRKRAAIDLLARST